MYFDADLHLATQRLLLAYWDTADAQGLLVKDLAGGALERVDNPYADGPRWSPDGEKFAYFGDGCLYVHDAVKAKPARVVELPDYHAGFCEWSPDGDALIFSAYGSTNLLQPPNIYRYDFKDADIKQITDNAEVDRFPKWSHSGLCIACHRTFVSSGENQTGIVVIDMTANREYVLPRSPDFSQRISRNCWSPDDSQLIVTEYRDDEARLVVYEIATGAAVWSSEETAIVGGCFVPSTGRVLAVARDALTLYEYPSWTPYAQLRLSDTAQVKETLCGPVVFFAQNEEIVYFLGTDSRIYRWRIHYACVAIIEPEPDRHEMEFQRNDYTFRTSDGYDIPVQQYIPANPNGRAVVFVEGGPGGYIVAQNAIAERLLAEGYEVIRPAYRGCAGYGADHLRANRAECGHADVWDVVECGIDWRQRFRKPNALLAVAGYSYGGYLTFLALTHQDAPWACGITFWGGTRIPPAVQTTGLPADPEERRTALVERSPVQQAHRIRFPLLILHGDRDTTALTKEVETIQDRVRGSNMRCDLIVFENEGHGLKGCRPQMYAHALSFLEEHTS